MTLKQEVAQIRKILDSTKKEDMKTKGKGYITIKKGTKFKWVSLPSLNK